MRMVESHFLNVGEGEIDFSTFESPVKVSAKIL